MEIYQSKFQCCFGYLIQKKERKKYKCVCMKLLSSFPERWVEPFYAYSFVILLAHYYYASAENFSDSM